MSSYQLLKKSIREYIYDMKWERLTKIQESSIEKVNSTQDNLILASPTASGKTEAAFLPAINSIDNWKNGVKIVYISPLIALINDQFKRILKLCNYMDISVTSWHGESSRTEKAKLINDPKGILLITPESIEAMLCLRPDEVMSLFKGTEWIIIDEIHNFLGNNRGLHLQSLVERVKLYSDIDPRLIAMSATLNRYDYNVVKEFFGNTRETKVLLDSAKNKMSFTTSYYEKNIENKSQEALEEIYDYSQKESMLVFPNSRAEVEVLSASLSKMGEKRISYTKYFSHHSSVSKELRLITENFAKHSKNELFTIVCTSTLELGIDIGAVDSIVQYNAPPSVASLGQRLGRSGRITKESILHFIAINEWALLQGLASISLYQEGVIDRLNDIRKPYDVLAHQILSILLEKSGVSLDELENINKKFYCWKNISDEECKQLIEYLVEENYIEILGNEAIIGLKTEQLLKGSDFFTHFETSDNFSIYNGLKKIGEIPLTSDININSKIILSAQIWEITSIDFLSKKIFVKKSIDGKPPKFGGDGSDVTNEIRKRMKEILLNKEFINEQSEQIKLVLEKLYNDNFKYKKFNWVLEKDITGIRTFIGTKTNRTILFLLNMLHEKTCYYLNDSFTLIYVTEGDGISLKEDVNKIIDESFTEENLYNYLNSHDDILIRFMYKIKYRDLLSKSLQIKYIINNMLDLKGAYEFLKQ